MGGGQTGQWLQEKCQQKGIETIGSTVEKWNLICITIQSDSNWNETELLGQGSSVDRATKHTFRAIYERYIGNQNIEAILISGSMPCGFKNGLYYHLVKEANQPQIPAFIDAS